MHLLTFIQFKEFRCESFNFDVKNIFEYIRKL